ncbi:hypothetical protein [Xanthomonas rydalmerensis]|uniref:Uncharacterized protein n=1 Tax=Xanthomonas rydalmerensis TaxID=3046274 RepID=A0ABZ0JSG0_9XANT|nr:hypothetical protein [Xanthomonas sp. DM-2023]WOS41909.1 hypothetical protein QN243_05470 [Xanthomonas sp. DM-2023]WOS46095.1 hypothetical protein QN242_05470 [Xanthomonas sp. DM-2023]WOS50273.1 hypothetical protein QN240_05470 [Xanthomonas sp. DM-2023]WOS54453.1 hypothetical protein QN244_05470 [Xanthomonas sp. DM-2023]WOS58636.1 hypothetical protein QN245_05470 [Xanthomonas sp. DM-2023]
MSKLKVHSVANKGDLASECVWIQVLEDIQSLSHYLLCDTTYTDENHVSNELRHLYWFNNLAVKKGDWIQLMTKDGRNASMVNKYQTTTHVFFWKLGVAVWNKAGDAALIFDVVDWKTTRV